MKTSSNTRWHMVKYKILRRRFLPPMLLTPSTLFEVLFTLIPPSALFVALFLWLYKSSRHSRVILLNDVTNLNLLSLGALVALCYVVYATWHQIFWRFDLDDVVFASNLICYHTHTHTHTHTHKHTEHTKGPIDLQTRISIYWQQLLCAHNRYLYYTEWTTCWYKNLLYRGPQCLSFSKMTHL